MDQATTLVFLLWHVRDEDDLDTAKLIGVFSSRGKAGQAKRKIRKLPGFADYPDSFVVDEYDLDQVNWNSGFVSLAD